MWECARSGSRPIGPSRKRRRSIAVADTWKSSPSTTSRMRITGLKKPKYDAVDARTIGLAAPTQCGRRTRCHAGEINACHAIRLPSKPCAEGEAIMITVPELAADALGTFLASYMQRRYGRAETRLVEAGPVDRPHRTGMHRQQRCTV